MTKRVVIALPLALAGAVWFAFLAIPWPVRLKDRDPERTALMEYRLRQAERRGEALELRHAWVPLERIPPHVRRAVIVAEDGRFYQHDGIDWAAIREELRYSGGETFSWRSRADVEAALGAVRHYLEHRDRIRGRSTITQQVAKNVYFTPERSLWRKAQELVVARRLERFLDKDRILEIYLNVAELGPGIFGVEAAARHYFGRSAANLDRREAAALAATLPHPLTSNPAHQPGRMAWRQQLILERMGGAEPAGPVPLEPPAPRPAAPQEELLGQPAPVPESATGETRDTVPADPAPVEPPGSAAGTAGTGSPDDPPVPEPAPEDTAATPG